VNPPLRSGQPETPGFTRTAGGRGGQLIRVTTLAPSGPGSLSEALSRRGPRIVVFEVGGVIDLGRSSLRITEPFLTVAGQTAPSPGITLIRGGLAVATHDVVIQHLRIRPGEAGAAKNSGWEVDGLSTHSGAYDVIVDHCSTTWATDENLSASGERFGGNTPDEWRERTSHRITFSNNLIGEGLSRSTHKKGEHSKGTLIHDNVTDVLIVDNLYASNVERNPFFKGGARGVVANNLIANPAKYAMKYTLVADEWGAHAPELGRMVVIGNVLVRGPNSAADLPLLYSSGIGKCEVYTDDNLVGDAPLFGGALENFIRLDKPARLPRGLTPRAASQVAAHIRSNVGARPWDRDAVDQRIIEQALSGGGAIVDSEQQAGGYPEATETRATFRAGEWDLATLSPRSGR
jgi:hypothetical protein